MEKKPALKTKPQKDDPLSVGHHMGKHYGYNVLPDGSVRLSEAMTDQMIESIDRQTALNNLLQSTNSFVTKELEIAAKISRKFWADVKYDLGLISGEQWQFDVQERTVSKIKEVEPKP